MLFGAKRDTPDRAARHAPAKPFLKHIAGISQLLTSAPVFPGRPPIFGQAGLSCEGHMFSRVICFALPGRIFVPSQLSLYRIGQQVERETVVAAGGAPYTVLPDQGTYTSDMLQGMSTWGVRAMGPMPDPSRYSDTDATNVTQQEDLIQLARDGLSLIVGPYRVDPTASDLMDQIRVARQAGIPVATAGFVDTKFIQWTGGAPVGAPDERDTAGGGHALAFNGAFRFLSDGTMESDVDNSWTERAGEAGVWRVSEAWWRSRWDIYLCPMTVSPAPGMMRAA